MVINALFKNALYPFSSVAVRGTRTQMDSDVQLLQCQYKATKKLN